MIKKLVDGQLVDESYSGIDKTVYKHQCNEVGGVPTEWRQQGINQLKKKDDSKYKHQAASHRQRSERDNEIRHQQLAEDRERQAKKERIELAKQRLSFS